MSERIEVCGMMQNLRDALDAAGVMWIDFSEHHQLESGNILHMERTKFADAVGDEVSVIYGWSSYETYQMGNTYGYPYALECWHKPTDPEPQPMTVEEILRIAGVEAGV